MAATMSTSQGPWKLETRYCGSAKEAPATSSAGQTSIMRRKPTMAQISQNGTMIEKKGSWRPIMPESSSRSSPVTAESAMTGVPSAPKATGAVLAIRQRPAAESGEKPSPISMAAVTATGVPKPAAPSKKAPKQKAMNRTCIRRSSEMPRIEWLQDVELALLVGQLVEEDDVEDDPSDRHQAEAGAVDGGHAGHAGRHAEGEDGDASAVGRPSRAARCALTSKMPIAPSSTITGTAASECRTAACCRTGHRLGTRSSGLPPDARAWRRRPASAGVDMPCGFLSGRREGPGDRARRRREFGLDPAGRRRDIWRSVFLLTKLQHCW